MPSRARLISAIVVVAVALIAGAGALLVRGGGPLAIGKALVGGPFALTDQNGRRVTEKDYLGRPMLVFFGYTSCPDVCPGGLQVMSAALDTLGSKADDIQPVFVTVDPARDSVAVMKEYAANFHPRMAALTGSEADIAAAAKAFRVFYGKPSGEEGKPDYLMDHSAIFYLMAADGSFLTHVSYGVSVEDFASKIAAALGR